MYRTVLGLGAIPFDAADQASAAEFADSLEKREINTAKRNAGWTIDDPRHLHDTIPPAEFDRPRIRMTGSSDVGDVSWSVPFVQIMASTYAIGTPFHSWQAVAQGKLPFAHKGMIYAAKAMAGTAISVLGDPELLAAAKAEHARATAENPYVVPLPDDVVPPPLRTIDEASTLLV